jgi:hypothetical protein
MLTSGARIPCLGVGIVVSMTADRTGGVVSKLGNEKSKASVLDLIGYRLCEK